MAVLETYANRLYLGHECHRWSVHPQVIIGGSIADADDWRHIRDDLGARSVLNVETEHDDEGKGIEMLCQTRVPDDGTPFEGETVRHAVAFAKLMVGHGPIYVHCQQGGSRSPAFAYAILRWVFRMSCSAALAAIREGKPKASDYGHHAFHQSYIGSVEHALGFYGWNPTKPPVSYFAEFYDSHLWPFQKPSR